MYSILELFLKNEDEYRFFAGLRRMTDKAVLEDGDEATAFEFEGLKVLLEKKTIYVVNEGELVEQGTVQKFERHPNRTFRRLMKYAEELKDAQTKNAEELKGEAADLFRNISKQ